MKKTLIAAAIIVFAMLVAWVIRPQKARLELRPELGQALTFSLDYVSDANAPSSFTTWSDPSAGTQSFRIVVKGELGWTVLSLDSESTEFLLELKPFLEQCSDTAKRLLSSTALARVRLKNNGELINLLMPQENFNGASVLITDILRHFIPLLIEKDVQSGEVWHGEEDNGQSQNVSTSWKLSELSTDTAVLVKNYSVIPKLELVSDTRYELDRQSNFLKKVLVKLKTQSPGGSHRVASSLTLTAALLKSARINSQEMANILQPLQTSKLVQENLSNEMLMQQQESRALEKVLGADTVDSLQTQLRSADPKGQKDNMPIYNKLKALFVLQPKSVDAFAPALLEYDRLDDRFSMVATALTAVGTPDAQRVLRESIANLDGDETKKQRLIPNLSFTHIPTVESEDFLRNLAQTDSSPVIRGTAHRALGTVAHNLREQDPARVENIFKEYTGALGKAQTTKEITDTLDVLGNIGIPEQLDSTSSLLRHQDPGVRERAYNSLRHIQDLRATEILIQALSDETIPKVREVIAEALSYQTLQDASWIDRVRNLIYAEQNIAVVKYLLRSLSQNSVRLPAAVQVIEQYAKDCGHPDLCGYVNSLLEALRAH
jgi:hypothetical protein